MSIFSSLCAESRIYFFGSKPSLVNTALASLTLQNMEQDGYICRSKSNKDSRIAFVQLTTKGKEQAEMMKLFFQNTDSQIGSKLSKEEYDTLCLLLDKIYGYLKEDN